MNLDPQEAVPATDRQRRYIEAMLREKEMNTAQINEFCKDFCGRTLKGLTKRQATRIIGYLTINQTHPGVSP